MGGKENIEKLISTNVTPNLFVIGAPKAGTSALVAALGNHIDIYVPEIKELRYFDAHTYYDYEKDYPLKSLTEYLNYYNNSESIQAVYRVDGSVFNMYSKRSIESILDLSPDAKFIVILRDPVSAVQSMHAQRLKYSRTEMREISDNLCECWNFLHLRRNGLGYPEGCRNKFLFRYDLLYSYELWLPTVIDLVPEGNLLVRQYEVFKTSPEIIYNDIIDFLRIRPSATPDVGTVNPSFHVNPTFTSKFMGTLAWRTFRLRKLLNITGGKYKFANRMMYPKITTQTGKPIACEDEIRLHFKKTYDYMSKLKHTY